MVWKGRRTAAFLLKSWLGIADKTFNFATAQIRSAVRAAYPRGLIIVAMQDS
jgi:hypothetical protein